MKGYTKADVTMHSDGPFRDGKPSVNVKVRRYPGPDDVRRRFGCSEATATQALETVYQWCSEDFYLEAEDLARETFGAVKVYTEGRSDGWLVVCPDVGPGRVSDTSGVGDPADWDGPAIHRWAVFERRVRELVEEHTATDHVLDVMSANELCHDEGARERVLEEALA